MINLEHRKRARKRRTGSLCLKSAVSFLWKIPAFIVLAAFLGFVLLNWITQCCEPGGVCIPEGIYPQCIPIHKEVFHGH